MLYTSAEANKLLKKFNEERQMLISRNKNSRSYVAAIEENVEDVAPDFELYADEGEILEVERKIRVVKHAINVFNTTHKLPADVADITIDEALVAIPMLNDKKRRLTDMAAALPKQRIKNDYGGNSHIEYRYANYDIKDAKELLEEITEQLNRIQIALDEVNHSEKMEIEI